MKIKYGVLNKLPLAKCSFGKSFCGLYWVTALAVTSCLLSSDVLAKEKARQSVNDFFAEVLFLDWKASNNISAVAAIEAGGSVVDLIIPQEDEGQMTLLSDPQVSSSEARYSRLFSIVTCPKSKVSVAYQRFYYFGDVTAGATEILDLTESSGLLLPFKARNFPGNVSAKRLDPLVNEKIDGVGATFKLTTYSGETPDRGPFLVYEAIISYPCVE